LRLSEMRIICMQGDYLVKYRVTKEEIVEMINGIIH